VYWWQICGGSSHRQRILGTRLYWSDIRWVEKIGNYRTRGDCTCRTTLSLRLRYQRWKNERKMVLLYTLDSQVDSTALKVDQGALQYVPFWVGGPRTRNPRRKGRMSHKNFKNSDVLLDWVLWRRMWNVKRRTSTA